MTGLYQYVPPYQAASLNSFAEFPNGTRIGSTFSSSDYIQLTPGMWVTVAPPARRCRSVARSPEEAGFRASCSTGQTYLVQMTAGYGRIQFLHWKDNNSTNLSRQVKLNGNASYMAVYVAMNGMTDKHDCDIKGKFVLY